MSQVGFFALRQIHYTCGEIVDPDRGAKFVVYDSDGLGAGSEQYFCSAEVPSGWVQNSDDVDDDCYSNFHD